MKNIALILLLISTFISGCDRETLKGLNLKINAEVKSDYDNQEPSNSESQKLDTTLVKTETKEETTRTAQTEESPQTQEVTRIVRKTPSDDPDAPLDFKAIKDCSEAAIKAKTNEIFYANNAQVKSIDSKNAAQVKEWKKIHARVSDSCR